MAQEWPYDEAYGIYYQLHPDTLSVDDWQLLRAVFDRVNARIEGDDQRLQDMLIDSRDDVRHLLSLIFGPDWRAYLSTLPE